MEHDRTAPGDREPHLEQARILHLSRGTVDDRTVSLSEALTTLPNEGPTVIFFQMPRRNIDMISRREISAALGIPREFWFNRYTFAGPGWGTFYSRNGWSESEQGLQNLTSHRCIFSFAVDFLNSFDVRNDMSFCYFWNTSGCNILTCFDVPRGIESNVPNMILHDSGLSTAPYGLPIILLGQVVDRFSNRTRLLSNQIRTTVEPTATQGKARLPEFLELYSCTRDSVVVTQCVKASIEVVNAMIKAHDVFRDACPRYVKSARNETVINKNMNEFDQTHSSLLYNQHELQGLNLLAQALDQRIQNSISLVFNTVAKQDSVASIELARAATKDSRSMRIIAFATILFLPATFVSAIFGTNFFSYAAAANSSIQVSNDFWKFWAITIPLTLLTVVVAVHSHDPAALTSMFHRKASDDGLFMRTKASKQT